jgi:hypothetical protein
MNDGSMPRNEYEAKQLFAESLADSYLSERRYGSADLERTYEELCRRRAAGPQDATEAAVEQGKVLFAIRHRRGFGGWRAWLEAAGLHFLQAERLIEVATWWHLFPEHDPATGEAWELDAACDALTGIKQSVWEQTGYDDTDVCFSALQEMGELAPLPPSGEEPGAGGSDPLAPLRRRMDTLVLELTHQVLDLQRRELLEPVAGMIAELQDLLSKAGPRPVARKGR